MSLVGQLFAGVAGLIHVLIFVMESLLFLRPEVYRRFAVASEADARTIRGFAFNQGFYNLFLAVGILVGLAWRGTVGASLVGFCCASMCAAAAVLIGTDRRMVRAAAIQGVAPLL